MPYGAVGLLHFAGVSIATQDEMRRLLVVIPNWVGDVVLATPTLAALREHFQRARITYLLRRYVAEVVEGADWYDELKYWPGREDPPSSRSRKLVRSLRGGHFDLALLLTNSFRAAAVVWLAGARQRIGYSRDGRGFLLTSKLKPLRRDGEYVPSPVLEYYAALAEHVGCRVRDRRPRLPISPRQFEEGERLKQHYGLTKGVRYAIINPGTKFGSAKCWLPERFSEVCDLLVERWNLLPVVVGAPEEHGLMRRIAAGARRPVICADNPATTLGSLKVLIAGATIHIGNDTGPRHYAIALGIPVVTIFGPTHQQWTDTGYEDEIKLQVKVPCGPCQLPRCPLDLRCMQAVSTQMVMDAVERLLQRRHRRQQNS
jgi:heptosyltransferase-2